jgi:hypothetical protein
MLLDRSISETYIEDCEICCNPMEITTEFEHNELISFQVKNIEQ